MFPNVDCNNLKSLHCVHCVPEPFRELSPALSVTPRRCGRRTKRTNASNKNHTAFRAVFFRLLPSSPLAVVGNTTLGYDGVVLGR